MTELTHIHNLLQEAQARLLILLDKYDMTHEETPEQGHPVDVSIWTSDGTGYGEQSLVYTFT